MKIKVIALKNYAVFFRGNILIVFFLCLRKGEMCQYNIMPAMPQSRSMKSGFTRNRVIPKSVATNRKMLVMNSHLSRFKEPKMC